MMMAPMLPLNVADFTSLHHIVWAETPSKFAAPFLQMYFLQTHHQDSFHSFIKTSVALDSSSDQSWKILIWPQH